MATAINFNWVITDKVTDGKVYDFNFTDFDNNTTPCTFVKNGNTIRVEIAGTTTGANVDIFRRGMRVSDALALTLKRAGRVTSGEVYRADILLQMNDEYQADNIYTGIHGPATTFGTNFPHKDSTYFLGFELETAGRNENCETALHNLKSNIWRQVSDSSIYGSNGARGIEFVSTLIHPEDAVKSSFYESFCDMLTGLAVSGSLSSTGLHCHISRTAFGDTEEEQDENITKLIYMENRVLSQAALERLFGRAAGGDWCRPNTGSTGIVEHIEAVARYAPRVMAETGIREALKTDLLVGNKTRSGHNYPSERYHRINITNQNTIEFRQGKGMIRSTVLANIAQHVCTIAKYCRETAWHKLSAQGYYQSIPNSAKYSEIKRIFNPSTDE